MIIPWTDEPGGLQSKGVAKDLDTTVQLNNSIGRISGEEIHTQETNMGSPGVTQVLIPGALRAPQIYLMSASQKNSFCLLS